MAMGMAPYRTMFTIVGLQLLGRAWTWAVRGDEKTVCQITNILCKS
jgi:hypothetical protein